MTPTTSDFSAEKINSAMMQAGRLLENEQTDCRPLTAAERRALGGLFFPEAASLVHEVGDALAEHGALFRDVPGGAPRLLGLQGRAEAWGRFAAVLGGMQRFAADQHLLLQGEAIRLATGVVQTVQSEAAAPFGEGKRNLEGRLLSLQRAFLVLKKRERRLNKGRPKKPPTPLRGQAVAAQQMHDQFAHTIARMNSARPPAAPPPAGEGRAPAGGGTRAAAVQKVRKRKPDARQGKKDASAAPSAGSRACDGSSEKTSGNRRAKGVFPERTGDAPDGRPHNHDDWPANDRQEPGGRLRGRGGGPRRGPHG